MTEPVASGAGAWAVYAGVLSVTALSGEQAGIVLGAFVGAMVFATLRAEMTVREKVWQGVLSWVLGMIGAETAAKAVAKVSLGAVEPSNPVGAVIAATVSLILLRGLMKLADGNLLNSLIGRGGAK
ncbi:putative holin [Jeongeupia sp. USM3]|uniref:putative holin n=1 Tax=Jeongeupia sp. USM3 TaxID=1906741 RepID=UPI00089E03A5|nr:putative holin [Jeongeupia sp. USM3]AOY00089.1 hypothetical protein BJP62_06275 [Jeongeupia sp. USM3]